MIELPEILILYILNKYLPFYDKIKNKLISKYYYKNFYNFENLINLYSNSLKFNYLLFNELNKKKSFHENFKRFYKKTLHLSSISDNTKIIKIEHYLKIPFMYNLEITQNDIKKIKKIIKNDFNKLNKKSLKIKIYLPEKNNKERVLINLIIY